MQFSCPHLPDAEIIDITIQTLAVIFIMLFCQYFVFSTWNKKSNHFKEAFSIFQFHAFLTYLTVFATILKSFNIVNYTF